MSAVSAHVPQAVEAYGGGGIDYSAIKRTYNADDAIQFSFTDIEDYYPVGLWAFVNNPNIVDPFSGWGLFKHQQPAMPLFLQPILGPDIPPTIPSFEAKYIRCISDQDCWIRFGGPNNVQHFISAGVWFEFYRRTNIIFVVRNLVNGTLNLSFYG